MFALMCMYMYVYISTYACVGVCNFVYMYSSVCMCVSLTVYLRVWVRCRQGPVGNIGRSGQSYLHT